MSDSRSRASESPDDDGFTLVELMVSIIIMTIIVGTLAAAMIVGLKTVFRTGEQLSLSNNAQQLSGYFGTDVQSAAADGIDAGAGTDSGCDGADAPTTNVVRLAGGGYIANYRRNGSLLERHSCAPDGARTVTVVVRELISVTVSVTDGGKRVAMEVTVDDTTETAGDDVPYVFSLVGMRRTPTATCEPLAGDLTLTPVSAVLDSNSGSGPIVEPVLVEFSTSGNCAGATVTYQFGAAGSSATVTATTTAPGEWRATIPRAAQTWTAGTKALVVRADGNEVATSFVVFDPTICNLVGVPTVAPNPGEVFEGKLLDPVVVTFRTEGLCPGSGSVTHEYGAGPELNTVPATRASSGTGDVWTATLPTTAPTVAGIPDPDVWTVGTKPFSFSGGIAAGMSSFDVVAGTCQARTIELNPTPVNLTGKKLAGPVTVTFTTNEVCVAANLGVTYEFGDPPATGAPPTRTVLPSGTPPVVLGEKEWTVVLPATLTDPAQDWTSGSKTVTVTIGGTPSTTSTELDVQ